MQPSPVKLGIFAKTFSGETPLQVLQAAQKAGFATVQYNMACSGIGALPYEVSADTATAIQRAARSTGVNLAAISATYNMTHPDIKIRENGRAAFKAIAAQAHAMGSNLLTVCSGSYDAADQWRYHPHNETPQAWAVMCREFALLVEIAEAHDLYIGVEPELANVVSSAAKAKQMLADLASPRVKIVLDPANLFEAEIATAHQRIIASAVDVLGDHIIMAHAKDRDANGKFVAAGTGIIDFGHFIGCLRQVGFNGAVVTHGLNASEAPSVAGFLSKILAGNP